MTRKQRDQVVELLRCAADLVSRGEFADDGIYLHGQGSVMDQAVGAWVKAVCTQPSDCDHRDDCSAVLLEAAARVEEGLWP